MAYKLRTAIPETKLFSVYISNIFLGFHYFLTVYINSSFLKLYFSDHELSFLYIAGSLINIVLLINSTKILRRFGNYKTTLFFIALELFAVFGLAGADSKLFIIPLFIVYQALVPMILFGLDVFLEDTSKDETKTGGIRGMFLTLQNITLVISPAIVAFVVSRGSFANAYFISALFLIPMFVVISHIFSNFKDSKRPKLDALNTFKGILAKPDIKRVFLSHLLLQFFYAWMVIFLPLLLARDIGFSWQSIGAILTMMLLPFILFELPIGKLADKHLGETELMKIGFFIMAVATIALVFIKTPNFFLWATILFVTRIGASFVEITSETYFFKKVNDDNADMISFFRMLRPLSFVIAPLIALFVFPYISYSLSFGLLGFAMFLGLLVVPKIDTK